MFRILNFINKLKILEDNSSHIVAYCPICDKPKLKINKNTGSYKCYANNCLSKDIRNAINPINSYSPANLYDHNLYYVEKLRPEPILLPTPYIFSSTASISFAKKISPNEIHYYYSDTQRIQRIISQDKKKVYPQYFKDNTWIYGKGNDRWSLYAEELLLSAKHYILIVEGEKCADVLLSLGYIATTPNSFSFTREYLENKFRDLKLNGVLYLSDNDEAGKIKQDLVLDACWINNIPASALNIAKVVGKSHISGYDVVDAINDGYENLIKRILCKK